MRIPGCQLDYTWDCTTQEAANTFEGFFLMNSFWGGKSHLQSGSYLLTAWITDMEGGGLLPDCFPLTLTGQSLLRDQPHGLNNHWILAPSTDRQHLLDQSNQSLYFIIVDLLSTDRYIDRQTDGQTDWFILSVLFLQTTLTKTVAMKNHGRNILHWVKEDTFIMIPTLEHWQWSKDTRIIKRSGC